MTDADVGSYSVKVVYSLGSIIQTHILQVVIELQKIDCALQSITAPALSDLVYEVDSL